MEYFRCIYVSYKIARGAIISPISEGLQRDHRREGNAVYGAKDEELPCAFIDKGSHACECYGLPLTAGGIWGGNIVMRLDSNEKTDACALTV